MRAIALCICITLSSMLCLGAADRAKKPLTLEGMQRIQPSMTTKKTVRLLLGAPSEIVTLVPMETSKGGELWEYDEGGFNRLSIHFEPGKDALNYWIWSVVEGDPEQNIKIAMSRFRGGTWIPETEEWINPHAAPNDCYFEDKKTGLSIKYNLRRREVFSISKSSPSRTVSSAGPTKSPTFCIDTFCGPGIPAAEYFKHIPVTQYCDISK